MEKYITNIKDLVIQVLTNIFEIKSKAGNDDALSCFQMGMINLLGINTQIDFKKASAYLGNLSLSDNFNANLLLGFIAECDGDYSSSFHYYANTESSEADSYLDKAIKGRNHLQNYLKNLDLPLTLNKEVSSILNDYSKNGALRTDASIKIAALCMDEQSCLEAAKSLFDSGDYISAIQWLRKADIKDDNPMCLAINEMFEKSKKDLLDSRVIEVVDLKRNSLLSNDDMTSFLDNVKKRCEKASQISSTEWKEKVKSHVDTIIKNYKDKECQAYLDALAEEEARKRKRNKLIKYGAIAIAVLFVILLVAIGFSSNDKSTNDKSNSAEAISKEIMASENSNTNSKEIEKSEIQEERSNKVEETPAYQTSSNSGYDNILSERKLLEEDLEDKTPKELELMRNSIYARYGYKFKREDLLNHFSQYSWYNPTTSDMGAIYNMMNDNEKYNVDFIKKHE